MRASWLLIGLLSVAMLIAPPLRAATPAAQQACDIPAGFVAASQTLPHLAAALRDSQPVTVLVVGSATVQGPLGAAAESGFPYQAVHVLRRARPGSDITMMVYGRLGWTAQRQLAQIRAILAKRKVTLVIWQTGTVEAVRNVAPGDFADALADGIADIHADNADVVLVDQQFSRFLRANTDLPPYLDALEEAADQPGVVLFHRYGLMHFWSTTGRIDLEYATRAQRVGVAEHLHACLGQALARLILDAAR